MNANIDAECPICQCKMIVPTTIPACGHKFCFICLKGVYMNDMGGCPMCRGPIDSNIFAQPSQVLDLKMNVPKSPIVTLKPSKFFSTKLKLHKCPFQFSFLNATTTFQLFNFRNCGDAKLQPKRSCARLGWYYFTQYFSNCSSIFQLRSVILKRESIGYTVERIKDGGDSNHVTNEKSKKHTMPENATVKL